MTEKSVTPDFVCIDIGEGGEQPVEEPAVECSVLNCMDIVFEAVISSFSFFMTEEDSYF